MIAIRTTQAPFEASNANIAASRASMLFTPAISIRGGIPPEGRHNEHG
jgi:hypothetical protein